MFRRSHWNQIFLSSKSWDNFSSKDSENHAYNFWNKVLLNRDKAETWFLVKAEAVTQFWKEPISKNFGKSQGKRQSQSSHSNVAKLFSQNVSSQMFDACGRVPIVTLQTHTLRSHYKKASNKDDSQNGYSVEHQRRI